jgi:two-component system chemotaxis response regulator CheV
MLNRLKMGENVFELIEFSLERHLKDGTVMNGRYGVNVAKVREVVRMPKINPLASGIPGVAGIFELRGVPIPAIHLGQMLGDKTAILRATDQIIVVEFSRRRAGFIVDRTEKIRRISWESVLPMGAEKAANLNGMTLLENNEFLFIVDLERIVQSIESAVEGHVFDSLAPGAVQHSSKSVTHLDDNQANSKLNNSKNFSLVGILLIDDSKFILDHVGPLLEKSGFRVILARDGMEGKSILEKVASGSFDGGSIDVVVSDVEMPKMDGMTLAKWIKEHSILSVLPVIIHSSLSSKANVEAGLRLGVNGYVVKNDVRKLSDLIREILGREYKPGQFLKVS